MKFNFVLFALVGSLFSSQVVTAQEMSNLDNKKIMQTIKDVFPLIRGPVDQDGWRPAGKLSITRQKVKVQSEMEILRSAILNSSLLSMVRYKQTQKCSLWVKLYADNPFILGIQYRK